MLRNILKYTGFFAAGIYVRGQIENNKGKEQDEDEKSFHLNNNISISSQRVRVAGEFGDYSLNYGRMLNSAEETLKKFVDIKPLAGPTLNLRGDKAVIKNTSENTEIVITEEGKNKKIEVFDVQKKTGAFGVFAQRNSLFQTSVPVTTQVEMPGDVRVVRLKK